jgi:hypothetical protein
MNNELIPYKKQSKGNKKKQKLINEYSIKFLPLEKGGGGWTYLFNKL